MHLSPKQIDDYKAAHAGEDVRVVSAFDAPVAIIKRPGKAAYRAYKQLSGDLQNPGLARFNAMETLCKTCVVLPVGVDLEVLLDQYPGLIETIGGEIVEFAGLSFQAKSEKL